MQNQNQEIYPAWNNSRSGFQSTVLPPPSKVYLMWGWRGLFSDIIRTVETQTNAPISLCIQAALGIGAFLQQGLIELESPSGHITSPSLLLFGVLEPASGKSFVMDKFTAPITEFIDAHTQKTQALAEKYDTERGLWEQVRKRLLRDLSKAETEAAVQAAEAGEDDDEQDAEDENGDEPEATESETAQKAEASEEIDNPRHQTTVKKLKNLRLALKNHLKKAPSLPPSIGLGILSDATPAAIPKFIKDNRIQSLAIVSAEAEEFLSKGIKNQSSILNKGFSGEKTSKHLATRGDESHHIPITAIIFGQPHIMEKAFGGENNRMRGTGTISRGLFTYPTSSIGYQYTRLEGTLFSSSWSLQPVDSQDIEERYRQWATKMLNTNLDHSESKASRKRLKLSREALDMWYRGRAELDIELRPEGRYAAFRDHGNRLPEQWLRVALVIHGYNHHEQDEVSAETLKMAIELVNNFSTEFQELFRPIPPEERDAMKLLKWINDKRAQGVRYIGKSFATTGSSLRPVHRLNSALGILTRNNEIRIGEFPSMDRHGRRTKSILILDLRPDLSEDKAALDSAIQEIRVLNGH